MKEMFNLNSVMATTDSVGEWGGKEKLASENINRIYQAIYDAAPDNISDDMMYQIMHSVWDDWGSEEGLLTLTDEQVSEYVHDGMMPRRV